ncbi:MAG TPA: hypothetical protein VKE25_03580, partial [Actinomycetes bacterium]|nr:hypothetical protein [Actinomycetes bacterium]
MRARDVGAGLAGSASRPRRPGVLPEPAAPDLSVLATLPPGAGLASVLESVDASRVDDFDLVDVIAACDRQAAWAAAVQAVAVAELAGRAVFAGRRVDARRLAGMEISARLRLSPGAGEHRVVVAQTLVATLPATLRA